MEEYSLRDSKILYPDDAVLAKDQYFHNLPAEVQSQMSTYWSDLKVEGHSNRSIYIGLTCFLALFLALGLGHFWKRKNREKYYD